MNAVQLLNPDGTGSEIWRCSYCRACYKAPATKWDVDKCCTCRQCDKVGELDRGHIHCRECRDVAQAERLAKRLADAKEVPESETEWVYSEDLNANDGFFHSVEDFIETYAAYNDDLSDLPEFVFACEPNIFEVDADHVAENAYENACASECEYHIEGMKAFSEACKAFNEANSHIVSYEPDYSRKVRVRPAVGA